MFLSSKENLISSHYLHCFYLGPHFLPRLPKQHPKCSSCLCPSIKIPKSSARVMLLKMYVRLCHSSVQNPPIPLHLSAKVKGPWLQGLYNLHHTHSLPYTSLTMHLCTSASAHFSSLTNILMFCDFIRPTLTPEPLYLLFPVYFHREQHGWLPHQLLDLYIHGIFSVRSSLTSLFKITTFSLLSTIPFPCLWGEKEENELENGKGHITT